mmetsp:Transcript_42192/g.55587  ORF Transcript_42192/g.55587 Transcript_42192/m.55587 type:complete len:334 (-) Transcript_42192:325-1326(-)
MSLCDIFPDDPSCTAGPPDDTPVDDTPTKDPVTDGDEGEDDVEDGDGEEPVDEEGEEGEGDAEAEGKMDGDKDGWADRQATLRETSEYAWKDPTGAQIAYFVTALSTSLDIAIAMFKHHEDGEFKAGEIKKGDTNFWELGHVLGHYASLIIMGGAACTQLLTIFGIAPEINYLVWTMGVGTVLYIIENISTILTVLAYDKAHTYLAKTTSTSTELTNAATVSKGALKDFIKHQAKHAVIELALWGNKDDWYLSQFLATTPEGRSKMLDKLEDTMHHVEEEFGVEHSEGHGHGEHKEGEEHDHEGEEKMAEDEEAEEGAEAGEEEADEDAEDDQ